MLVRVLNRISSMRWMIICIDCCSVIVVVVCIVVSFFFCKNWVFNVSLLMLVGVVVVVKVLVICMIDSF